MADQVEKIILQVENREKIAESVKLLQQHEAAILANNEAVLRGKMTQEAAVRSNQFQAESVRRLREELNKLQAAQKNYGMVAQQLAYGLGDFAAASGGIAEKLNAVGNNVQQMMALLNLTSKWGIALQLLIPIITAVARNWDQVAKLFGVNTNEMTDHVDKLKARIKELEEKKVKVAVDIVELKNAREEVDRIQRALEAVKRLKEARSDSEQAAGKQLQHELEFLGADTRDLALGHLRQQFISKGTNENVRKAKAELKQKEDALEQIKKEGQHPMSAGEATAQGYRQATAEQELEAAREKARTISQQAQDAADREMNELIRKFQSEGGVIQEVAIAELNKRFARARQDALNLAQTPEEKAQAESIGYLTRFKQAREIEGQTGFDAYHKEEMERYGRTVEVASKQGELAKALFGRAAAADQPLESAEGEILNKVEQNLRKIYHVKPEFSADVADKIVSQAMDEVRAEINAKAAEKINERQLRGDLHSDREVAEEKHVAAVGAAVGNDRNAKRQLDESNAVELAYRALLRGRPGEMGQAEQNRAAENVSETLQTRHNLLRREADDVATVAARQAAEQYNREFATRHSAKLQEFREFHGSGATDEQREALGARVHSELALAHDALARERLEQTQAVNVATEEFLRLGRGSQNLEKIFDTVRDRIQHDLLQSRYGGDPKWNQQIANVAAERAAEQVRKEFLTHYNERINAYRQRENQEPSEPQKRAIGERAYQDTQRKLREGIAKPIADRDERQIQAEGLYEKAAAVLAEIRSTGGRYQDQFGREQRLRPEQYEAYVQQEVARYLHTPTFNDVTQTWEDRNRRMSRARTADLSKRIAQGGARLLDQRATGLGPSPGQQALGYQGLSGEMAEKALEREQEAAPHPPGLEPPTGGHDGPGLRSVPPSPPANGGKPLAMGWRTALGASLMGAVGPQPKRKEISREEYMAMVKREGMVHYRGDYLDHVSQRYQRIKQEEGPDAHGSDRYAEALRTTQGEFAGQGLGWVLEGVPAPPPSRRGPNAPPVPRKPTPAAHPTGARGPTHRDPSDPLYDPILDAPKLTPEGAARKREAYLKGRGQELQETPDAETAKARRWDYLESRGQSLLPTILDKLTPEQSADWRADYLASRGQSLQPKLTPQDADTQRRQYLQQRHQAAAQAAQPPALTAPLAQTQATNTQATLALASGYAAVVQSLQRQNMMLGQAIRDVTAQSRSAQKRG